MDDWQPGDEAIYTPPGHEPIRVLLLYEIENWGTKIGAWKYRDFAGSRREGWAQTKYLRRPVKIPTLEQNVARREARQRELIEARGWKLPAKREVDSVLIIGSKVRVKDLSYLTPEVRGRIGIVSRRHGNGELLDVELIPDQSWVYSKKVLSEEWLDPWIDPVVITAPPQSAPAFIKGQWVRSVGMKFDCNNGIVGTIEEKSSINGDESSWKIHVPGEPSGTFSYFRTENLEAIEPPTRGANSSELWDTIICLGTVKALLENQRLPPDRSSRLILAEATGRAIGILEWVAGNQGNSNV